LGIKKSIDCGNEASGSWHFIIVSFNKKGLLIGIVSRQVDGKRFLYLILNFGLQLQLFCFNVEKIGREK
jgi:hypothetical protein